MPDKFPRRTALKLMGTLSAAAFQGVPQNTVSAHQRSAAAGATVNDKPIQSKLYDLFAMQGDRIITEEDDFGIINGLLTMGVNYRDVGTLSGLFAPPYASSDFLLELRLFGEKVSTKRFDWRPIEVRREGELQGIAVSTSTILIHGKRAGILSVTFRNTTPKARVVPVQLNITGDTIQNDARIGFDYVKYWGFSSPDTTKSKTSVQVEGQMDHSAQQCGRGCCCQRFRQPDTGRIV